MASKHKPHIRLKALRKIIGLTQEKLAKLLGVSYPYLLSIETGQREMTEGVLHRIVIETGISSAWMGGEGPLANPINVVGDPYTEAVYREWKEPAIAPFDAVAPHYDVKLQRGLWLVAQFLRSAARSGRFGPAMHLLQRSLDSNAESLGITARFNDERLAQPDPFLTYLGLGSEDRAEINRRLGSVVSLLDQAADAGGIGSVIDKFRAHGSDAEIAMSAASVFSPAFICRIREAAKSGDRAGATKAIEFAYSTLAEVGKSLMGPKNPSSSGDARKAVERWAPAAKSNGTAAEPAKAKRKNATQ